MSIVCGTDFSELAAQAATAAACIAARAKGPLHLVHALDLAPEELRDQPGHPLVLWAESHLAREQERLAALGAEVQVHALPGSAGDVLERVAHDTSALLVVVGAHGRRRKTGRGLGSRADDAAQHCRVPVLAVRDATPFVSWLREERALRIVIGVDTTASADNAARWLDELCKLGPCDLTLSHLYWPPEMYGRLGIEGTRDFVAPDPEIVKALEQQLRTRQLPSTHAKARRYRIEPYLGRVGDGLAALAAEARADLLVVGVHHQSVLELIWEGSVARQALRASSQSVLCVPAPRVTPVGKTPRLGNVLCATDFSELGNGALGLAYAAVAPGGTVHLLHVVKAGRPQIDPYDVFHPIPDEMTSEAANAARARLTALAPSDASAKAVTTQVHVLEAADTGSAVCQAAERLGVDLICLGAHGRTGLMTAAFGSVAARVLANTRRPVLLARSVLP
jgi:nucleotide-binding universal stress UspA family protein